MFIGVVCKDERMQQVADQLAKDYHVQFICNRADFLSCSNKIDVCILSLIHIFCETSIKALENNKADYANTVCCDRTSSSDDECSCYGFDHDRE